jgi:hypothetical protein
MIPFFRLLSQAAVAATLAASVLSGQTPDALEVHGAINTGYGRADNTQILGIPSSGTTDYRNITLQLRYHLSESDQFVLQLLNRRLGGSPLQAALPDIAMHWAYWQRKTDWVTVKIGRAPMPRGLFNEVRFVGTVLPLYRPSFEIYGEGRETVDGFVASQRYSLGSSVGLQAHLFGGANEVRTQVVTTTGNSIRAYRGMPMIGGQVFLTLPFETKLGAYGASYAINPDTGAAGRRGEYMFSAETKLGPATFRTEGLRIYGINPAQDRKSGYVQGVANVFEDFDVVAEYSMTNNRVFQAAPKSNLDVTANRDFGYGLTYHLNGNALVRIERHEVSGFAYDRVVPFLTQVAPSTTLVADPTKGGYWLASFAVSF